MKQEKEKTRPIIETENLRIPFPSSIEQIRNRRHELRAARNKSYDRIGTNNFDNRQLLIVIAQQLLIGKSDKFVSIGVGFNSQLVGYTPLDARCNSFLRSPL